MSFHLQPKQRNTKKRSVAITLGVTLSVLALYALAPNLFSTIVRSISAPIQSSKRFVSEKIASTRLWSSKAILVDENIRLRKQNEELEEKLINYSVVNTQNEELRSTMSIRGKKSGVIAVVTSHFPQSPYDFYTLELPDGHRASSGNEVATGGTIIGKIIEVNGRYAKAELFSSPKVETEVRLMKDGTPLTLFGRGGGNFVLSAPRGLDITDGDIVLYGANPDYVVAVVRNIEETEADSFKQVRLLAPKNIFRLQYVEVLYAD